LPQRYSVLFMAEFRLSYQMVKVYRLEWWMCMRVC
jgi:hypothetical protein